MPAGIPVGTLAIGEAGATNAGSGRAHPALSDPGLADRLRARAEALEASIPETRGRLTP